MPNVDNNMFSSLRATKDLTQYVLMRGVTDFADLSPYNLYESGYSFLIVVGIPSFLEALKNKSDEYRKLIENYVHILEYDFRGLNGIDNMTAETGELTNGISNVDIINRVTAPSASTFSMEYFERAGSVISRTHELFLRGVKDPRTQVKTYGGLIQSGEMEPGYEKEVFSFMYLVADNTLMNLEKAYYIVAAQPTGSQWDIYNSDKSTIEFKTINVEFKGYPITSQDVSEKAKELLDWIRDNTEWREDAFQYTGVTDIEPYEKDLVTSNGNTVSW
jgi:hypothetical protein